MCSIQAFFHTLLKEILYVKTKEYGGISCPLSPWQRALCSLHSDGQRGSSDMHYQSLCSTIADMEFIFRVKLDVRHRYIFGGIEGRHHRFWRTEFLEVTAGISQAEVVGVGRPVAPGLPVRLGGGGNSSLAMVLVALELCQDVECISVQERIRTVLGGGPDLVEEFACGIVVLLP